LIRGQSCFAAKDGTADDSMGVTGSIIVINTGKQSENRYCESTGVE